MNITIGLSFAPKERPNTHYYVDALMHAASVQDVTLEVIDLFTSPQRIDDVDGILFTGGADIDPIRYGKESEREFCGEINLERDKMEFMFADKADQRKLPIMGICRGLQLLNVHYGGTLIVDLPRAGKSDHSKLDDVDRRHEVHVEAGTLLKKITQQLDAPVSSAHHQAIDQIAPGMKISAHSSDDNVIEAFEWEDLQQKPYLLAVQWHPERMDFDESLSGNLFENFLSEVTARKILSERMKAS